MPLPKTDNQAVAFLGQGNALSLQYKCCKRAYLDGKG